MRTDGYLCGPVPGAAANNPEFVPGTVIPATAGTFRITSQAVFTALAITRGVPVCDPLMRIARHIIESVTKRRPGGDLPGCSPSTPLTRTVMNYGPPAIAFIISPGIEISRFTASPLLPFAFGGKSFPLPSTESPGLIPVGSQLGLLLTQIRTPVIGAGFFASTGGNATIVFLHRHLRPIQQESAQHHPLPGRFISDNLSAVQLANRTLASAPEGASGNAAHIRWNSDACTVNKGFFRPGGITAGRGQKRKKDDGGHKKTIHGHHDFHQQPGRRVKKPSA